MVNILAEDQKDVSGIFASKRPDKFADVDWTPSANGQPIINGSLSLVRLRQARGDRCR